MNVIKTINHILIVPGLKVFEYFERGTKFNYSPEESQFNHDEINSFIFLFLNKIDKQLILVFQITT